MNKALIEGIYECATPSISQYSLVDYNNSVEEEPIYDTPCEDEGDYGPIYTEPPTEIKKIYENFEDKICSKNIRYIAKLRINIILYTCP